MEGEYCIELDDSVRPVIQTPRRVPHSLHDKLKVDGCLVTLVYNDSDFEDEESLLLWRQLCYEAHVEVHVRGLKSGYYKDVHGQVTITQRDENRMKYRTREVQFKILEENVTFFAPGISKAVL